MEIKAVQPAFTGRKLTPKEAQTLIQKNWTIPMGINSIKISKQNNKPGFFARISNFFKNLTK